MSTVILTDDNIDTIPKNLRLDLTFLVILGTNSVRDNATGITYKFSKELVERILTNASRE